MKSAYECLFESFLVLLKVTDKVQNVQVFNLNKVLQIQFRSIGEYRSLSKILRTKQLNNI